MNSINIENLITAASGRLGITPEKLREALRKGDMSVIRDKMSPSDRQKLDAVMNNPELAEKLRKRYMEK